ncbi:hypothetical protein TRICI_003848 [Trichomonascus ciferrii]|uniref:protein-tyrosine-phosphatase n=1 Tax=Trichomonascus ciferrii TaxID=44093 RepID=A0A642V257_9ASCO|nr:hypothetical protein TRICI_003848 [Trichomonascus ciferrii]
MTTASTSATNDCYGSATAPPPPPPRIFQNMAAPPRPRPSPGSRNPKKLFLHIESNDDQLSLAIPNNTLIIPSNIKSPSDQIHNTGGCYPDGPLLVYSDNIYLYSEPDAHQAAQFDVVINVAKEVKNPFNSAQDSPEYIFIPWDHNSNLVDDLRTLTNLIDSRSRQGKKILIHCQCGVSRSASLVVAYVMKKQNWDLNTAYNYVKKQSPSINPNMSLMFQLIDWQALVLAS